MWFATLLTETTAHPAAPVHYVESEFVDLDTGAERVCSLLGGTLVVETGPGVERIDLRLRAHTRGALLLDGVEIPFAGVDLIAPWQPVVGTPPFALPTDLDAAPVSLSVDERVVAVATSLRGPVADDTFRGRAAAATRSCATSDARPCVSGIGAIEYELTAWSGDPVLDRVVYTVERALEW